MYAYGTQIYMQAKIPILMHKIEFKKTQNNPIGSCIEETASTWSVLWYEELVSFRIDLFIVNNTSEPTKVKAGQLWNWV